MNCPRFVQGTAFGIRFVDMPDHLRAHVHGGVDSQAVSIEMWRLLGAECGRTGAERLLVLEELESTVDRSEIGPVLDAICDAGLGKVRIAFVEMCSDIEGNEFGELMLRERGMAFRVFGNEDLARAWLVYGDD